MRSIRVLSILTLLIDQGTDAQGPRWRPKSEKFQSLNEILAHTTEPLVILGALGSGKSTLLRHFELNNAQTALSQLEQNPAANTPLTFFIQLNDFKGQRASDPTPLLLEWLSKRWAHYHPDLPDLRALIEDGRITLLLDALNEIPYRNAEVIQLWKDFLAELEAFQSTTRVIFTCRSLDYSAPLSSKERPVPQVRIESLSDDKIEEFLRQYSPDYGDTLWKNLRHSAQLDLFRSPYYLKMLIEESINGQVPSGRAALFTAFVRRLIKREIENPNNPLFEAGDLLDARDIQRLTLAYLGRTDYELPKRGRLIPKLGLLAFQMQKLSKRKESGLVKIDYDQALAMLEDPLSKKILDAGVAMNVLEQDLVQDQVFYIHQLLQEYFAAHHFAAAPEPDLAYQAWQADAVSPSLQETLDTLGDADPLPPLPSTGWEETLMLASAMLPDPDEFTAQLMNVNLALAGRCAAQPDVKLSAPRKKQLQQALVERTQNPAADVRARIAAGFSLGELGDPRFQKHQGADGAFIVPPLIPLSGGSYPLGSDEGLHDNEAPLHQITLAFFQLAQFPVTNAEWRLFMEAGGYDDERWWQTDAAQAWRRGDNTSAGPKLQLQETRKLFQAYSTQIREWQRQGKITSKQADDWETIAQWSDEDLEKWLNGNYPGGRLTEPAFWRDDTYNRPTQPVVGICWHEANAYCAWLSAHSSLDFRLPTEAESEAAARGAAAWRFAYGDTFDNRKANTFESHIRATTPVGVFPDGNTPQGLQDMTGNVCEWTSSLLKSYPYDPYDGRENQDGSDGRRVVRGGSWYEGKHSARAAARGRLTPVGRNNNLGFRLACSSPFIHPL
ncbi:SUMF1/EgtB/PvdO family nonheme iron enzyme [Nitrosomonas communis]|uniref:NACHT domain-containing protein n=1 Tax=Nitrosomonas communis TaxID=44574 RepID=A0A1I4LUZ8_9PROT|nr:SUMF1/EgtB/PvdO family nonheme iron enzyme [Nitrosomonas communis]SFL94824.1 NACHT domain-containing protein [Nitrosomonas communis]